MNWTLFPYFASAAGLCWCLGAGFAFRAKGIRPAVGFTAAGLCLFAVFIAGLWIALERPPLRTMGETRLWYSFFLPVAGLVSYVVWRYRWILLFTTLLSLVFVCINVMKPEIHDRTLMPALQSPWFAPHVIVYMLAYAILGAATAAAVYLLVRRNRHTPDAGMMSLCDNLAYVGMSFMTVGMLFGALWAKEAWGHYWSWDPKETWAAATWTAYLIYIHFRKHRPSHRVTALYILLASFLLLQICWYGVNYLPAAKGRSVHVYSD
jgi:ABC-type transport system involved in cytochrome c biogenesis permease subunit